MDNNNTVKKLNIPARETLVLLVGEAVVSALVALGFYLCDLAFQTGFSYRVFTGAALGALVVILNFLFLSVSVNRAVDRYMEIRGSREMTDEEAESFTAEQGAAIQNSIKTSYLVRTVTMMAALVVAFILDWFNPLATVIPILAFRPILTIGETVRQRFDKTPDPEKFIKYSVPDDEYADSEDGESLNATPDELSECADGQKTEIQDEATAESKINDEKEVDE